MYKFTSLVFTIILSLSLFFLTPVFALDLGQGLVKDAAEGAGYSKATSETTFAETVGTVIKAVLSLVGVVFTFLIAYAGTHWMMARGNDTEIEEAKKWINAAILGLVVTLAAYTLSNFAVNALIERATGG